MSIKIYESGERLITKEEYHVFSGQLCVCVLWVNSSPYTGETDISGNSFEKYEHQAKREARKMALKKLAHYNRVLLKEVPDEH